jgi:glycosyltransferase involved in cell wall biosynthesis
MWKNQKLSIVFPCYNEESNIKRAIEDFSSIKFVDEVIVVDNNSSDSSAQEIKKTNAKYILETKQGYGAALMRGMKEATGDIIITAEPDNSFMGKDIIKLLVYADDFEVVFGTRTSKTLIWNNAKMDWHLRVGNWGVAKFLEYLHNGPCLTDVGCTMKLIKRPAYENIKHKLSVHGSHFSPEFMIHSIRSKAKCVEVPVNYRERIGSSKITSDTGKAIKLGFVMIGLIIKHRFKRH